MADDDKTAGNSASSEDPWAGIDADPQPADTEAEFPSFDALSLGASDGVFSDETEWNAEEQPLAVFPPAEQDGAGEPAVEGPPALALSDDTDVGGLDAALDDALDFHQPDEVHADAPDLPAVDADADALAHLEDADDDHVAGLFDADHAADDEVGRSVVGQSTIEIGTGRSGIVPFDDASLEDEQTGEAGDEVVEDPFSVGGEMPGFEDVAEAAVSTAAGAVAVGAASVGEATVKPQKPRKVQKRSSGGGLLAVLGVLLGGVLSIPIVFGILFWVFKKDPFKIAPNLPPALAFLVPAELTGRGGPLDRVASRAVASRSLDDLGAVAAGNDEEPPKEADGGGAPPADGVAAVEPDLADEPAAGEAAKPDPFGSPPLEQPSKPQENDPFAAVAADEPPPAVKEPAPLDLSALESAAMAAVDATKTLQATDEQDGSYKATLREWYTTLAKVGEESAALEQAAMTSGRKLDSTPASIEKVVGRMLADDKVMEQLAMVSKMWLKSKSRTSDGVVLPAVLGTSREVGPWWFSKVRVSDDPEVPEVSIVSRMRPNASEGDPIVVIGLVFEPGVVWAAECGRFAPDAGEPEPEPEPAAPKAPTDDLFPVE